MIEILLSTYNSQNYLENLFKSLHGQSFQDWNLLIRDDGSADHTISIIEKHQSISKNKFKVLTKQNLRLGPKKSFEKLLEYSTGEYVMFCDHDDYWLKNKIKDSFDKIKKIEKQHPEKAVLIYTDLIVSNNKFEIIDHSYWNYSNVDPKSAQNIYKLMVNNPVVGCTIIMNRKAIQEVLPIPEQACMHDWWSALKICEAGVIDYLDKATILYRLHDKNEIGVEKYNMEYVFMKFLNLIKVYHQNINTIKMVKCLEKNYSIFYFLIYKILFAIKKLFVILRLLKPNYNG